ncbi:MAG: NYN domain-containing protein [Candidatus Saccharimonadales bacterium]|jgi:uncharacterized LabA/DUF88 family protein
MSNIIYIDGQNFLYKVSEVLIAGGKIEDKQNLHNIAVRTLFEDMFPTLDNLIIRFYGTKLRFYKQSQSEDEKPYITERISVKSKVMVDSQRRLKDSLSKQNVNFIGSGKLKLRDSDLCNSCGTQDLRFQEKGVDVKIAVDMITDTINSNVEKIILVSSDTDLIPAVKYVKSQGREVIYVGFSDKLTKALVSNASATQIIRDDEIIGAYDSFNNPQLELTS